MTPLDTLHKATREYDEWIVAQQALKGTTAKKRPHNNDQEERGRLHIPRCQVDASWATNQSTFGGGFVMELQDGTAMTGSLGGGGSPHSPACGDELVNMGHAIISALEARYYAFRVGLPSNGKADRRRRILATFGS